MTQTPPRLQPLPDHRPAKPIADGTRIGHVHLKVADLDRALSFYRDVLGFELMQRYGSQAAFLSAGGYHHHIGLNTWESLGGKPPPPGSTGLYHTAILYPTRARSPTRCAACRPPASSSTAPATTASARRSTCATTTRTASSCTGTSRASCGRSTPTAQLHMGTRRLDLNNLLAEAAVRPDQQPYQCWDPGALSELIALRQAQG